MYILGAEETLLDALPEFNKFTEEGGTYSKDDMRIYGSVITCILVFLVFLGVKYIAKVLKV